MDISHSQIFFLFVISCLSGLEAILDEFQLHRPLIACTLTGLALGDVTTGIILGGTLEMIALGWMNVGASLAPDAALASIISTILAIAGKRELGEAIALAIFIAPAGQVLSFFVRKITSASQHAADRAALRGDIDAISRIHLGTLALISLRIAIPVVAFCFLMNVESFRAILNSIPSDVTIGLNIACGFVVVVGYAMVINLMRSRHLMPFFFLGFVIAGFMNFSLIGLTVIGAILAILYTQLSLRHQKS